jgi:hypothetical protein
MRDEISDRVQDYYLSLTFMPGTSKEDIARLDKFMSHYAPCFSEYAQEQPVLPMELITSNDEEILYHTKSTEIEIDSPNEFYIFNNESTARLIGKILPELRGFRFIAKIGFGEPHWKYANRTD